MESDQSRYILIDKEILILRKIQQKYCKRKYISILKCNPFKNRNKGERETLKDCATETSSDFSLLKRTIAAPLYKKENSRDRKTFSRLRFCFLRRMSVLIWFHPYYRSSARNTVSIPISKNQ